MADNMDKLLYLIGEEANGAVDYDEMYQSILTKSAAPRKMTHKTVKYLGMAAACVIILGAAAMLPGGYLKGAGSEQTQDIMEAEAGIIEEAAVEAQYDAAPVEEAPAEAAAPETAMAEEAVITEDAADTSGSASASSPLDGGMDECTLYADTGSYYIGMPDPGLEERLKELCPAAVITPCDREDIDPGYAEITVSACENTALWNTGSGVICISAASAGSAEDLAALLRGVCSAVQ